MKYYVTVKVLGSSVYTARDCSTCIVKLKKKSKFQKSVHSTLSSVFKTGGSYLRMRACAHRDYF